MRLVCLSVRLIATWIGTCALPYRVSPMPPGLAKAQAQMSRPLEGPMVFPRKRINLAQAREESQELQKLADAVPAQVNQVTAAELPKDLLANLKKIEKISEHLRTQVSP